LKRFVFLSLSLLVLLILIPACSTSQTSPTGTTSPTATTPPERTPPVITNFSSNLNSDNTSTLSWNVTGADSVSIDQNIGMVSASGTKVVAPATATVYTLTATYAKGTWTNDIGTVTKSVTVQASVSGTPWVK